MIAITTLLLLIIISIVNAADDDHRELITSNGDTVRQYKLYCNCV